MKIGKKIKKLRTQSKESLQQVADAVGVSKAHIWELESGHKKVSPSVDLVKRLAKHFSVTISYLIEETGKANAKDDTANVLYQNFSNLNKKDQSKVLDMMKLMQKWEKEG